MHQRLSCLLIFGTFTITAPGQSPVATHVPLELDKNENGKPILTGHISKSIPQWKNFVSDSNILVIFNGSHCYFLIVI
jgi:predicted FMN-binding regulatory protein PaiB